MILCERSTGIKPMVVVFSRRIINLKGGFMVKLNLSNFWQGKKIFALIITFIIVLMSTILNKNGIQIDPSILISILGLNALYILRQGSIDSKKIEQNAFKPFWESRKFIAMTVGSLVPMVTGYIKKEFDVEIPSELIFSLVGLDAVYILRQGALDAKEPDKH